MYKLYVLHISRIQVEAENVYYQLLMGQLVI